MKSYLLPSIKLTIILILICAVLYPLLIAGIARFAPGAGGGEKLSVNGRIVGYANIGQRFTGDEYFWGRPSAVNYNAAGSGGSNKGASNPDYLELVKNRVDSSLVHNPGIKKNQVPAEMVTASGSGLDPDISPASAGIQADRVARCRKLPLELVQQLIDKQTEKPLLGPDHVNVLKLNIELDKLKIAVQ